MKLIRVVAMAFGWAVILLLAGSPSLRAMPNFARKTGMPCMGCHTVIPRLNEIGYKYRAAGFRMPADIGKAEEKFDVGNYIAGRLQARYDASRSKNGSTVTSSKNQFTFHEVTLYPASGSWGKYFGSLFELSLLPEEPTEIENAYLRVAAGNEKHFFTGRVGIFHPFEGFGGSDRPIAISRPLFQTSAANFNQSTYFTPWGFDEAGAEVGFDYKRTSVRATIFNGLTLKDEDGSVQAFAAQGGVLTRGGKTPGHNNPDFQIFANQILHENGGNISAYYYHGSLALPIGGDIGNLFKNTFDRVAFYAGFPIAKQALVLGGFQHGRDHILGSGTFTSRGFFTEVDLPVSQYAIPGVRYDWFDPARNKTNNEVSGVTTFVNVPLQNGVQAIGEYKNLTYKRGALPDRKDNVFQIRFIFIL